MLESIEARIKSGSNSFSGSWTNGTSSELLATYK